MTVIAIEGNRVKLGIQAPKDTPIRREELGPADPPAGNNGNNGEG